METFLEETNRPQRPVEIMHSQKELHAIMQKFSQLRLENSELKKENEALMEKGAKCYHQKQQILKFSVIEKNLVATLKFLKLLGFCQDIHIDGKEDTIDWVSEVLHHIDKTITALENNESNPLSNSLIKRNLVAVANTLRYLSTFDLPIEPSIALTLFTYIRDFQCCPFRKQIYLINAVKEPTSYTTSNSFVYLNYQFKIALCLSKGLLLKPVELPRIVYGTNANDDTCTAILHVRYQPDKPIEFTRKRADVEKFLKSVLKGSDLGFQKTVVSHAINWCFPEIFAGVYTESETWDSEESSVRKYGDNTEDFTKGKNGRKVKNIKENVKENVIEVSLEDARNIDATE